jgi:hypothetical protein
LALQAPDGRKIPKIVRGSAEPQPSIINDKTVADFTRVVEQTGILKRTSVQSPRE